MRILQITQSKYYNNEDLLKKTGGVEIYLNNICKLLKKQGYHSSILAPGSRKSINKNIIRIKSSQKSKLMLLISSLIKKKDFCYNIFSLVKFLIKERNNFDIYSIHSHTYLDAPIIIFFLRIILRKNVVVTIHGLNEYSTKNIYILQDMLFWRLVAWFSCLISNKVIFISLADKNKLKKMFTPNFYKKFYWIPNSINTDTKKRKNQNYIKKYFTFIGDLSSGAKGFDLFIKIMVKLHKDFKYRIPVLVLGSGPLESLLLKNKDKLEIKYLRYIKHDEISKVYNQTKVFFLTSKSEGLPTTILEAMLFKVPIIATDIPATRQIIIDGYNGFLFPPNKPEIGIIKLKKILNNNKLRIRIINNGRKIVERNYSWENNFKKILMVYNSIY